MPNDELRLDLPADWVAPSLARPRLREWLDWHQWSPGQAEDIVLVASEAISNSIEHGYLVPRDSVGHPGFVVMTATVLRPDGHRRVRLVVRDHGVWRPVTYENTSRGHGLDLMRSVMAEVVIDGTDRGTTLTLTSRPSIPLPPPAE